MRNEHNFSSKYDDIDFELTELPYPGNGNDWNDEVHTDRTQQDMFHTDEILNEEEGDSEAHSFPRKSALAHKELEAYVKHNRLYYAVFYSEPEESDKPDCRYAFAVGVSPSTGNLVGICSLGQALEKGDYQGIESDEEEEGPNDVSLQSNFRPSANADGSPKHLFYEKKNEKFRLGTKSSAIWDTRSTSKECRAA